MSNSNQFDAIVIGSGIGGLTTAAILSKFNHKKVLILEQHFVMGGFTQQFQRRGKFHWDVGLHYVGDLAEGEIARVIFDYITEGNLQWNKMPDPFEKFVYPDFTFEVSSEPQKYQSDLIAKFPDEAVAIKRYFSDLKKANILFTLYSLRDIFPSWLSPSFKLLKRLFGNVIGLTTKEYLERNFQNPQLKGLLASQWGNYGLVPSKSSFGIHALIVNHYLKGGWYSVGGAKEIAKHILPTIEKTGGKVLTRQKVTDIILENGVAVGVKTRRANRPDVEIEEYYAPVVVSDAGAFNTYTKLIPESYSLPYRDEIKRFPKGSSALTLYLGFKESPAKLGFQGENHWIYTDYDHDQAFQKQLASLEGFPNSCFLSFPSLKDPAAQSHTAEIISFVDYDFFDFFAKWKDKPWRRRGVEYSALKTQLSEKMIELVESYYPGFKNLIEYSELSTPLTVEYMDASDKGTICGIPAVPERLDCNWIGTRTPIKNLYLTGADAYAHGILGAMMGGVNTVGILNGLFGFFKIMSAIMKESA